MASWVKLLISCSLLVHASSLHQLEKDALSALYDSSGGSSGAWTSSSGWGEWDNNICSWYGVGCSNGTSNNDSHVVSLVLVENGLSGELPSQLGYLTQLDTLDLNNNELHGMLPQELCDIGETLTTLALWDNGLNGSIPDCYGTKFTRLQTLSLESNKLTGSLPALYGISGTLDSLWLYNNSFTGTLEVLGDMKALNTIDLRSNLFSGSIPASLCNLGKILENIVIWNNSLTGQIPACFANLEGLEILAVGNNFLSGPLPTAVCNSSSLRWLILNTNSFYGTIPECYGDFGNLNNLQLQQLPLSGTIPESLCRLSNMDMLSLYSSSLTGNIPSCLGNYANATSLDLHGNMLTGSLPENLCAASMLQYVILYSNHLTGTIPACYATSFTRMLVLELQDNKLHGDIPVQWSGNVQAIVLSNNMKLEGTLPPSLFSLTNLQAVVIEGTNIHGTIPSNVADAKLLEVLALAGNRLTGTIPDKITTMSSLINIQLPRNQLTGTIPFAIGNLTNLHRLVLCGNMISGQVPESLSHIAMHLDDIELDLNRLSCKLPRSLLNWPDFEPTKLSPKHPDIEVLTGNLFACPDSLVSTTYTTSSSVSLYNKDAHGSSYRCGNSSYVPVLFTLYVCFLIAMAAALYLAFFKKKSEPKLPLLGFWWKPFIAALIEKKLSRKGDLHSSITSLAYLLLDIVLITVFALAMGLPVLYWSPSSFTCQYLGHYTLAYKRNIGDVSGGVMGCIIALVLLILSKYCFEKNQDNDQTMPSISSVSSASNHFLSISSFSSSFSTCSPLTTPPPTPTPTPPLTPLQAHQANTLVMEPLVLPPSDSSLLPSFGESNQLEKPLISTDWQDKDSVSESFADPTPSSTTLPTLLVILIVLICIVATLGPNMIYVLILVNGNSTAVMKTAAQVGISLVKVVLGCFVVPFIAVRSLRLFVQTEEGEGVATSKLASLYRDRVVVEIVHAAASLIFFPVAVVMVADPRCYYYYFRPRGSVTTTVHVTFCSDYNFQGECLRYDKLPIDSTFHYNFAFDGEQCVSAIFETYTPVFIATPLISAALDIFIGEFLLPIFQYVKEWHNKGRQYDNLKDDFCSDLVSSPNMWLNKQEKSTDVCSDVQSVRAFYLIAVKVSRQVVERARRRLLLLMLTICTFGIGAPLIAVSTMSSALVVFTYHVHLLGRISALVDKKTLSNNEIGGERNVLLKNMIGELSGWDGVPRGCGIALCFTTAAFWSFVSIPIIETIPEVCGAVGTLAVILLSSLCYMKVR